MHTVGTDVLFALRSWRRAKLPVAAAVLALGLGIGATTTVFSVVAGIWLEPLPYTEPHRLVMVWQDQGAAGRSLRDWVSPGLFVEWARRSSSFDAIGAVRASQLNLTGVDEPERLRAAVVSAGYLDALGTRAALGRTIAAADDRPGGPQIAVLSHGLWQRRFGGDPSIVGRTAHLDGQITEVVGVMPASFRDPVVDAEIWTPLRIDPAAAPRAVISLRVVGRLKPDVTVAAARAEMSVVAEALRREDPEWERLGIVVVPLLEEIVGRLATVLVMFAVAVAMVLALACANVTSLLLARATDRVREITIRAVLGASRARIVRQLLTESAVLAAAGGTLGVLLAVWGVRAVVAMAPPQTPRLDNVGIDGVVLAFAAVATLTSAVVSGVAPALAASRVELTPALRDGGRGATSGTRLRSLLVVLEVAVAMVLAVGAGLLLRSLVALQEVDLGFTADRVVTASISPPRTAYPDAVEVRALYADLLARLTAVPGIEGAAVVSVLPLSGMDIRMNFAVEGREPARSPSEAPVAGFRSVSPGYFDALGIAVVEGRGFTDGDRSDAEPVVVVNEALALQYWPPGRAVGQRVGLNGEAATVVGVVRDVRHAGPAVPANPELYQPLGQSPARAGWIVARAHGSAGEAVVGIRASVRAIDPNLPIGQPVLLKDLVSRNISQARFVAGLLTGFSALATLLALVGIYGVLSFAVSRRTRDIGVRMALGARRRSVVGLILGQSLGLVTIGVVLGGAAAAGLSRLLATLLFGVEAGDPATIGGAALTIAAAAVLASLAPALRAARIDPLVALREE